MSVLVIALGLSVLLTAMLLRFSDKHERWSVDPTFSSVQKLHVRPVPRIGGVAIFISVLGAMSVGHYFSPGVASIGLSVLVASLPTIFIGFVEDISKRIGVKVRLAAIVISAVLCGYLTGAWLPDLQIFGLDHLIAIFPMLSVLVTCFAVVGVTNSFNVIDGFNGISGVVAIIISAGLAYVAFQVSDYPIMIACFALIGAILGFLVFNYPLGLIFLGDSGAYFIGFWIAEFSVLLTVRNPEVSKWFPLLLCFYPVFELLFTIFRRVFLHRTQATSPDAKHLHNLIYFSLIKWLGHEQSDIIKQLGNSFTSPYLWALSLLNVVAAISFWNTPWALRSLTLLFLVFYILLYFHLARKLVS